MCRLHMLLTTLAAVLLLATPARAHDEDLAASVQRQADGLLIEITGLASGQPIPGVSGQAAAEGQPAVPLVTTTEPGRYRAALLLREPGPWSLVFTIADEGENRQVTLLLSAAGTGSVTLPFGSEGHAGWFWFWIGLLTMGGLGLLAALVLIGRTPQADSE